MSPTERGLKALSALGVAVFLVVIALLPFTAQGLPFMPICPFKGITGLPCPLCGGTRAAHALLQGDLGRALYLNPLAIPVVAVLVMAVLILAYEAITGTPLANWPVVSRKLNTLVPLGLAVLVIWWLPHIYMAVRTPKLELLELSNPIARALYAHIGAPTRN